MKIRGRRGLQNCFPIPIKSYGLPPMHRATYVNRKRSIASSFPKLKANKSNYYIIVLRDVA